MCIRGANEALGKSQATGLGAWVKASHGKYNTHTHSSVNGSTYYINDFMAVGHAMYDIHLVQVMKSHKIDRIFIQRAPCATSDLCVGLGTWLSFYRDLYSVILTAADSLQTQVYVRFNGKEPRWSVRPLVRADTGSGSLMVSEGSWKEYTKLILPVEISTPIMVQPVLCFEEVYFRKTIHSFEYSITPKLAKSFKEIAYELSGFGHLRESTGLLKKGELHVVIAHRGNAHYREMHSPKQLKAFLENFLENEVVVQPTVGISAVTVTLFDTSAFNMNFQMQIEAVTQADVVICTHGAFEANVMYMRPRTLLIELRGVER